ncbi:hypothetical protein, partial [Streptomyces zagrosensis]
THQQENLAARLHDLIETAGPLVEKITGLTLPAEPVFRILIPKVWRAEAVASVARVCAHDLAECPPAEVSRLRAAPKVTRVMMRAAWVMSMGLTVTGATGRSETLVSAEALRHTGLLADPQVMGQTVAHELVHHAQNLATGGDRRWVTLLPHLHGIGELARDHVVEGHARWADRLVTAALFGVPVDDEQAPRSRRYRRRAKMPLVPMPFG